MPIYDLCSKGFDDQRAFVTPCRSHFRDPGVDPGLTVKTRRRLALEDRLPRIPAG
jgi:hypothetical protein